MDDKERIVKQHIGTLIEDAQSLVLRCSRMTTAEVDHKLARLVERVEYARSSLSKV